MTATSAASGAGPVALEGDVAERAAPDGAARTANSPKKSGVSLAVLGYGLGLTTALAGVWAFYPGIWQARARPPEAALSQTTLSLEHASVRANFALATLRLQFAASSSRPWSREFDALQALAPAGAIPQPLIALLQVHAVRGVPNEAELRERFAELAPQLPQRLSGNASPFDRLVSKAQSVVANLGLMEASPEQRETVSITTIEAQLRRGNLRGALTDSESLDPGLRPYLASWLVDLQARVAVEQAINEILAIAIGNKD
ncbi:MAG: hypothetical protein RIS83_1777 [Pseudomonadota bacterium]